MERERPQRHMPMIIVLHHLSHGFDFCRGQACRDHPGAAPSILQIAAGLGTLPTVVARRRETRDSERCAEREDLACSLDRSQEKPLGVACWKSLVIDLDLGYPNHGDQKTHDGSEQSRSTPQPIDLIRHLRMIMGSEIASNHIGHAAMNPASNGRAWDVQLGEELTVSGFADGFLDSVVVGPSRVESFHLERIGRVLRGGGAARKCPVLSRRCRCNAPSPECSGTQLG
jgi:hypothetical protein